MVFSLTGVEISCFGGSLLPTPPDNAPLSNPLSLSFYNPSQPIPPPSRFGFHNASTIDSLLDKDDVLLEAILDEDDLIQECKAQNTRLIDYFGRVDVLHKLLGYVTEQIESEEKGKFKSVAFKHSSVQCHFVINGPRYPYIATEVLCCEIWSIVDTCVNEQQQLLVPFWEVVLDKSPDEMKTQTTMASHFAKVNSVFMSKKPAEVSRG